MISDILHKWVMLYDNGAQDYARGIIRPCQFWIKDIVHDFDRGPPQAYCKYYRLGRFMLDDAEVSLAKLKFFEGVVADPSVSPYLMFIAQFYTDISHQKRDVWMIYDGKIWAAVEQYMSENTTVLINMEIDRFEKAAFNSFEFEHSDLVIA